MDAKEVALIIMAAGCAVLFVLSIMAVRSIEYWKREAESSQQSVDSLLIRHEGFVRVYGVPRPIPPRDWGRKAEPVQISGDPRKELDDALTKIEQLLKKQSSDGAAMERCTETIKELDRTLDNWTPPVPGVLPTDDNCPAMYLIGYAAAAWNWDHYQGHRDNANSRQRLAEKLMHAHPQECHILASLMRQEYRSSFGKNRQHEPLAWEGAAT